MDYESIPLIVDIIITVAAVFFGIGWVHAKNKISELRDLLDVVDDALQDDKVSEEEFREIFRKLMKIANKTEFHEIVQTFKEIVR